MRDGNKQSVVTLLKRELIKKLYENPCIIELLDHEDVDPACPDTAEWVCIFPYIRVVETQQEVHTYIGIAIESPGRIGNEVYKELTINITVFCPMQAMRVAGQKGTRTDILAGDISETLNWNDTLGFELKFSGEREGVLDSKGYYFRTLFFTALRQNDIVNGRKRSL